MDIGSELEWKTIYEVGYPLVDEQHKGLFDFANRILSAEKEGLSDCVNELYAAVQKHFIYEESFLEEQDYSELEEHKLAHLQLLEDLKLEIEKGLFSELDRVRFKIFYEKWLMHHVLNEDGKYVVQLRRDAV